MTLYFLKDIRQSYAGRTVLDIAELALDAGNIYTLTGPNGAGKTTLLNILSFLSPPSAGQMTFNGIPVKFNAASLQQFRKSVVLVDQHPILFSTTVFKNIEFGLKIRKISRKKRNRIIQSSLSMVGMKAFINADARYLSGGETKRIAIARALACAPNVLIMDEPTANLDIENQLNIESIIREIHRQHNVTIIFCTHNIAQGARLASQHIHLFAGRVTDTEHENIFKGEITALNGGQYFRINEKVLIQTPATDKRETKISIHPGAIKIVDRRGDEPVPPSLRGKVMGLSVEKDWIRAMVDVGVLISLIMETNEYDSRNLRINDLVDIEIHPDGITFF
ncbi:MAG: ABC transporter ATP-binding protein [Desulfobacteraceae bacterium]|nr:ABC transporter ATP-binding protein [Desulfobacteraceae bacterium]